MEPDEDGFFHTCTSTPSLNPDGSEQVFRPEWRTEAVIGLAKGIVEDSAFERMPILADALEEAGCDLSSVLLHCREPIAHIDDCWVLERILCRIPTTKPAETEEQRVLVLQNLRETLGLLPLSDESGGGEASRDDDGLARGARLGLAICSLVVILSIGFIVGLFKLGILLASLALFVALFRVLPK